MIETHKTCPKCGEQVKAVEDMVANWAIVEDDFKSVSIGFTIYYPCWTCRTNLGNESFEFEFKLDDAEAIEEGNPGDYRKARGILAGNDEPAEVSIRRLRDGEQRDYELTSRIQKLEQEVLWHRRSGSKCYPMLSAGKLSIEDDNDASKK